MTKSDRDGQGIRNQEVGSRDMDFPKSMIFLKK